MQQVNVIAASFATRSAPVAVSATLTDNMLHIHNNHPLPANLQQARQALAKLAQQAKTAAGSLSVFVEDPTGMLKGLGYAVKLSDVTQDGRPVVVVALERYQALTAMQAITYPPNQAGQYQISASLINHQVRDNGESLYQVDWESLKDQSRVLLLAIHGVLHQGPQQADYLQRLYQAVSSPAGQRHNPFDAVMADLAAYDYAQHESDPYYLANTLEQGGKLL